MSDSTMVRMREMNRLKHPPASAGPICCSVVVLIALNWMCASTIHAAMPRNCPVKAAAANTHKSEQKPKRTSTSGLWPPWGKLLKSRGRGTGQGARGAEEPEGRTEGLGQASAAKEQTSKT